MDIKLVKGDKLLINLQVTDEGEAQKVLKVLNASRGFKIESYEKEVVPRPCPACGKIVTVNSDSQTVACSFCRYDMEFVGEVLTYEDVVTSWNSLWNKVLRKKTE